LDNMLSISVFLPLIVGFVMLFCPSRFSLIHKAITLCISVFAFVAAIILFRTERDSFVWTLLQIDDIKLMLTFSLTPLRQFMLLFAMGFGVLITMYSFKSRTADDDKRNSNIYYGSILLTLGGSAGILLSNNLLFLLVFWEIVTLCLYLLISTGGKGANFAATKSFALLGVSDAAFMLGVFMVWKLSGTFIISDINIETTSAISIIAFLLLMTAAITKAGAMPLHTWVPTSGEYAPASVMALLPAAIDKLLGIYLLIVIVRQMFVVKSVALSLVLTIIGAVTIIIAVMVAMVQHNLKKLLSYHAISQVGYMILGIATGTPVGIAGGVFHMLNNAIYKSCLFLCGGAVEQRTGTADLEELGGLGKKMPWTFAACLIAALSISGIPPFNGFVSKWMVYQGVIQMGAQQQTNPAAVLWPVWLLIAMFGSALTLASFVKIIHSVFLSRMPSGLKDVKEVSALQVIPMSILALLCVFFGIFYNIPLKNFIYPALAVQPELSLWGAGLATILVIVGIIIGVFFWLIGRFSSKIRIVHTWTCGEKMDNDRIIISGTQFYKTVSSMGGLKQLYSSQEKGYFDLYEQGSRVGSVITNMLRWVHSGVLPVYLTWVTIGILVLLFAICRIW
jgi:formate hydrogenlyase subunit 3/multisubunit Na+/H+ antiporter MnhD subunit